MPPLSAGEAASWSYAALYHPWLRRLDAAADGQQLPALPPDGPATGVIARRTLERGAWIAPANQTLVGVAALRAAAALAEWRAASDRRALGGMAVLLVPAAVAAVVAVVNPALTTPDPDDVVACADDHGITVCLYPIDEPNRAEVVRTLAPFARLFPAREFVFTQEYNAGGLAIGRLGADAADRLDLEVGGVAGSFVDDRLLACNEAPYEASQVRTATLRQILVRGGGLSDDDGVRAIWQAVVDAQVSGDGGDSRTPEEDARLDPLSDDEFLAWFDEHRDAVAACRAMPEDLP